MKIQPYIEKLESSQEYKKFQEKHENSYIIAGFFVLDFETGQNLHQVDYFIPTENKVAAFTLDKEVELRMMEMMKSDKKPEELNIETNIDLDALKGIVEDEMKNRGISEKINKMIAIIQNIEGKKLWNINCVLSGMELLRTHVDDDSETILKMERNSMMDYIKKVPGLAGPQGLQQTQAQPGEAVMPAQPGSQPAPPQVQEPTKEEIENKIKQLDKLKEILKQEEVKLEEKELQEKQPEKTTKDENEESIRDKDKELIEEKEQAVKAIKAEKAEVESQSKEKATGEEKAAEEEKTSKEDASKEEKNSETLAEESGAKKKK